MRKVFTTIIFLFIIICGIIIYSNENNIDKVNIISLKRNYIRLITSKEETVTVPMYFDTNKSFLTSIESISESYLLNDNNQIKVSIDNIRCGDSYTNNLGKSYDLFLFDLKFEDITINEINIDNARFKIIYKNQDILEMNIGNFNIRFNEIISENNFDVYRLFITVKEKNDKEYITGIVIGINDLTNQGIVINDISIGTNKVIPDLKNSVVIDEIVEFDTDIDDILGYQYDPFLDIKEFNYKLNDNKLIFVPMSYNIEIIDLKRFPIYINYSYLGKNYEYLIDDFIFISEKYSLEENYGEIQEYTYYY